MIDLMLDLSFESVSQEMVHLKNVEAVDSSGELSKEEKLHGKGTTTSHIPDPWKHASPP